MSSNVTHQTSVRLVDTLPQPVGRSKSTPRTASGTMSMLRWATRLRTAHSRTSNSSLPGHAMRTFFEPKGGRFMKRQLRLLWMGLFCGDGLGTNSADSDQRDLHAPESSGCAWQYHDPAERHAWPELEAVLLLGGGAHAGGQQCAGRARWPGTTQPATFRRINYFTIFWQAVPGATGYDVLRTTAQSPHRPEHARAPSPRTPRTFRSTINRILSAPTRSQPSIRIPLCCFWITNRNLPASRT